MILAWHQLSVTQRFEAHDVMCMILGSGGNLLPARLRDDDADNIEELDQIAGDDMYVFLVPHKRYWEHPSSPSIAFGYDIEYLLKKTSTIVRRGDLIGDYRFAQDFIEDELGLKPRTEAFHRELRKRLRAMRKALDFRGRDRKRIIREGAGEILWRGPLPVCDAHVVATTNGSRYTEEWVLHDTQNLLNEIVNQCDVDTRAEWPGCPRKVSR